MAEETARKAVQIGVDLRPIPVVVGEDTWNFTPDPDKSFFMRTAAVSEQMQSEGDERWDAVDALKSALSDALVDEEQKKEFGSRTYGLTVLGAIASAYAEEVVGVPTESAPASGSGQRTRGATK